MAAKKKTTTPAAVSAPVPAVVTEKKAAAPKKKKVDAAAPVVAAAEVSEAAPVAAVETRAEEALHVSRAEFTGWVREAAFQLAQQRQFRNGSPANDWFRAEQVLTEQLAARGVTIVD